TARYDTSYPAGLCTRSCGSDAECDGAICVGTRCAPRCASGTAECDRWGGTCTADGASHCEPSCFPAGRTAPAMFPSCPAGHACDVTSGYCGGPMSTDAEVGAPCEAASDCRGQACITAGEGTETPTGFLGGYCTSRARQPDWTLYVRGEALP